MAKMQCMKSRLRNLFGRLNAWLPWNRPSLADLPLEERRRIKAMMLGAGAGAALRPNDEGRIVVQCETEGEDEDECR